MCHGPLCSTAPRAQLARVLTRRRSRSGFLAHSRRRVCRPTVVIRAFRCLLIVPPTCSTRSTRYRSRSRSLAPTRACPPTDRPYDTTTAFVKFPPRFRRAFPARPKPSPFPLSCTPRGRVHCPFVFNRFSVVSFPSFSLAFLVLCQFRQRRLIQACFVCPSSPSSHIPLTLGPPTVPLLLTPAEVSPINPPRLASVSLLLFRAILHSWFATLSRNRSPG